MWSKLILGRFRYAVVPDFSQFPAGSDDYCTITLTRFSVIPVMGEIAVDMSQGLRICLRVFCLLHS